MAGNAGTFIHSLLKYSIGIRYIGREKQNREKVPLPAGKNGAGPFRNVC